MKKLTVKKDVRRISSREEIAQFELDKNIKFPEVLTSFLLEYEGLYLSDKESYFVNKKGYLEELNCVLFLRKSDDLSGASIEAILDGHREDGRTNFIPFGTDSGGWDYCISVDLKTYGQVWVDKFDSGENDPMEFVAESLEEFINGLGPDPED